ncbi:uncharacterized protein LOC142345551 [Convolutriloba macropyga]|uniref:uncharacterized protein LOC142345551 n=1 Tax=Convolutriloba macropyga TaxID=536237 RepID=UPI003F51D035
MGRLMLWVIPRSKSTIVLKSLSSNPQIKGIFEPFAFAFFAHFYENKFVFSDLIEAMKSEPFTSDNIVWKDVPSCVENLDFEKFFPDNSYRHALLVRHPKEVCMSQISINGKPTRFIDFLDITTGHPKMKELFQDMVTLRDFLRSKGYEYKVFDSTNLGSSTDSSCEQFMRDLCEFGQLPFDKEMMLENMQTSEHLPDHWWKAPTAHMIKDNSIMNFDFHGQALKTTKFMSTVDKPVLPDLTLEQTDKLNKILEETMPNYELLIS